MLDIFGFILLGLWALVVIGGAGLVVHRLMYGFSGVLRGRWWEKLDG